ncbi:hypothetical protein C2S51_009634 [Perilla frutescens var. frutescens]|nr:hypothetical protein C2S51_009634 [Perilla frutescens var. frutescens]
MGANDLNKMLDARVSAEGANEEVIAKLAERCLSPKGQMRPTMKEVARELEGIRISQMPSI